MAKQNVPFLVFIPPPIMFAATFLIGVALNRMAPWHLFEVQSLRWLGSALIVVGLLLAPVSAGRFVLRRTTLNPAGSPSGLVTTGAYAWTRNPMYLGLFAIYVGVALLLGQPWPLALLVLPLAVTNWVVIPFEETQLRSSFGSAYEEYCRRVRRWL